MKAAKHAVKAASAAAHLPGSASNLPHTSFEGFSDSQPNYPAACMQKAPIDLHILLLAASGAVSRLRVEECVFPASSEGSSSLRTSPAFIS